VPFATIAFQLERGVSPFELRQLVGNALLLLPLGIYGPMLTPSLRSVSAILLAGAAVATVIELGQLAVATLYGFPLRVADVDDVLLNTAGVLAGYVLWRGWSLTASVDSDHAVRGPAD
jgi:glycopeptide antibiotics resistance protein